MAGGSAAAAYRNVLNLDHISHDLGQQQTVEAGGDGPSECAYLQAGPRCSLAGEAAHLPSNSGPLPHPCLVPNLVIRGAIASQHQQLRQAAQA